MTNQTRLGDLEIDAFKVGENDCKIYLGDILIYDQSELPYSQRYLTLDVISGGTIMWIAKSGVTKTISYSVDDGTTWTEITSTSTGTPITVSVGDKVLLKGENVQYATDNKKCSCFSGGTAYYNIEGNIMSLVSGDSFTEATSFTSGWVFHSLFDHSNAVSAKNLVLPVMELTEYCYRAMFANATHLIEPPQLPATTLARQCYWFLFENCAITESPELPAKTLAVGSYGNMFTGCTSLTRITCLATDISASSATTNWVKSVAASGVFVKDVNMSAWSVGLSGIPQGWVTYDLSSPTISYDGFNTITITCDSPNANIYYRFNKSGSYSLYTAPIVISADTVVEAYSENEGQESHVVSKVCIYVSDIPFEASNRMVSTWLYNEQEITIPYSINAIDGHSASYAKGSFNFETEIALREAQPTYLWFQHADQSAEIHVNNTLVETHYGGYNAFFSDISNYVQSGVNNVKVTLNNTTRTSLAPCTGDFNFNATLGYVKLFTSHYVPSTEYGYDGFHVTSNVTSASATIDIRTNIPSGADVVCTIDDGTFYYSASTASTGSELLFTTTIQNPHLWNGKSDPHMYTITLEIYHDNVLYHRYIRPYGLRFYEYVVDDTEKYGTVQDPYTGFLLNGSPYLLRGVCMHNDLEGKANALTYNDIDNDFALIDELGCNFLRLAHYPHPKEVYDKCDELGIIVQTEVPWVNNANSTQPSDYYTHLEGQYRDMVNQHYNHPCIMFWGLANEITTDDKDFAKAKIEEYASLIRSLDSERLVGYVMSHSYNDPSEYYGNPDVDWFGGNIYVGWYISTASNDPTSQLNTRVNNIIVNKHKALAFSEYGAGGTQHCHSDNPLTTTTRGNNPRHDIEYQMWLHEGHIAAIRNFPQLLFTAVWQLFDIAVSSRNEGYTVCLDGENTSVNDELRRLNDKGLVERNHSTKKDTFYIYKAEWSSEKFIHICGKDYTKKVSRAIKCYTNVEGTLSLYVNDVLVGTAATSNHIAVFEPMLFSGGDVVRVDGGNCSDTFTFDNTPAVIDNLIATFNVTSTTVPTPIGYNEYTSAFTAIEIDGVVQSSVVSAYTFDTLGEHVVKYELVDNEIVPPYAFANCSELSHIDILGTVITISENAFYNCDGLTSVTIPYSVTSIGASAFADCGGITKIVSASMVAPTIQADTFKDIRTNGTLYAQSGATNYDIWMGSGDYYLGKYGWTLSQGVMNGDYGVEPQAPNSTWVYDDVDGAPIVSTDENGYVTDFEYTDASESNPVGFSGSSEMDTQFLPFKGAKDFEIIFHCKARQDEQTYRGMVDGVNWDNMTNVLEFKLERANYEGVGLRFNKAIQNSIALNYRKYGESRSANYLIPPLTGEHADEWNYRIVFQNSRFTMYDRFTGDIVKDSNNVLIDFTNQSFGDIDDLTLCIGAAYYHVGNIFFRFAKCEVYEFKVTKL